MRQLQNTAKEKEGIFNDLYHGTYCNFDKIDLSVYNKGKDFGRGFYLSEDYDQALSLATFKSIQYETEPIVIAYEFDEKNALRRHNEC